VQVTEALETAGAQRRQARAEGQCLCALENETRTALYVTPGTGCTRFLLLDGRKNSRGKSSTWDCAETSGRCENMSAGSMVWSDPAFTCSRWRGRRAQEQTQLGSQEVK